MPSDELTYINLKLAALGQPTSGATSDLRFLNVAGPLLRNHYQKDQLLGDRGGVVAELKRVRVHPSTRLYRDGAATQHAGVTQMESGDFDAARGRAASHKWNRCQCDRGKDLVFHGNRSPLRELTERI